MPSARRSPGWTRCATSVLAAWRSTYGMTVDTVCDRALISHRTSYSYFASKEAAVLGSGSQLDPAAVEAFRCGSSEDVLGVALLLLSTLTVDTPL